MIIMLPLQALVEEQTRHALGMSEEEFAYIKNPNPSQLHDSMYYKDMRELISYLHDFKTQQQLDPNLLLVVDTDYDSDGVMSATILSASLSVFDINYRVYIPSMEEGYGLSVHAIQNMKEQYEHDGYRIGMILTADNGIKAFKAVTYAKHQSIKILITDHHPSGDAIPDALAVVNPNQMKDLYPFKGNAGACVAWKAMLAYAKMYQPQDLVLIDKLIVFAGIANVADVMPILNENRYIVKAAVDIVNTMRKYKILHANIDYTQVMNTPYVGYNTAFHGLFDILTLVQEQRDALRAEKGKKPILLPDNEELFSWYLSPLFNAPRRVHETCLEAMVPFLISDKEIREYSIHRLIDLNTQKSILRDTVLDAIDDTTIQEQGVVLCANTRSGISGLIAGQLSGKTGLPAVIFSHCQPHCNDIIYNTIPQNVEYISASARSNAMYPLDMILEFINEQHPNMVSGGGHAAAAGFTIKAKDYDIFKQIFQIVVPQVHEEMFKLVGTQIVPENKIILDITTPNAIYAEYRTVERDEILINRQPLNVSTFQDSIFKTFDFQNSLRPFGKDFNGQTVFQLRFDNNVFDMSFNANFWKTFRFIVHGVEVLTFDVAYAPEVLTKLSAKQDVLANIRIAINEFQGRTTPQFILEPCI